MTPSKNEPASEPAGAAWWTRLAPSLLPGLVMLVIGAAGLSRPALGWDEHATWSAAVRTPAEILRLAGSMDGVIAPYYLFQHYWIAVAGDSVTALRLPSLLAAALGVGLTGELGRRLFSPGIGLVGALIVAGVPQLSRYAAEARVYGIAFFLAVLATLLLYRAMAEPSWRRWSGYGVTLTLLGYAHVLGLLILAGHLVILALRLRDRDDRRQWRGPAVVAGALVLAAPLLLLGLGQRGQQLDWVPPVGLHEVLTAPGAIFGSALPLRSHLVFGAHVAGLFILGLALAARWERPRPLAGMAALAVLPPALLLGISLAGPALWVPRYVLIATVPAALLAAVTLRGITWRAGVALILLAGLTAETHLALRGPAARGGMNFRTVAAKVEAGLRPGDGVVYGRVGTWSLRAGLDYELRDRARPRDLLLVRTAAEAGGLDAAECPTTTCFDEARVWYVGARRGGEPMSDAGAALRAKFAAEYTRTGLWVLPLGVVALYERR